MLRGFRAFWLGFRVSGLGFRLQGLVGVVGVFRVFWVPFFGGVLGAFWVMLRYFGLMLLGCT